MFRKYIKYIKYLKHLKAEQKSSYKKPEYTDERYIIHKKIELNLENLRTVIGESDDIIFREFKFGIKKQTKAFVCFIDGLGDKKLIDEYIVKPLMVNIHVINMDKILLSQDIYTTVKEYVLNAVEMTEMKSFDEVLHAVLSGETALFIDGYDTVLGISAKGGAKRNVEKPDTERVVRGSREGFTETLRINTSMVRRKLKNSNLVFKTFQIGKQTHTDVSIAYIDGIADKKVVDEVKNRLNRIDTDAILESGYIEQFIEDNPFSPFSTIGNTEKPDIVAAKLLEGRVAVFCDGTPFVLTLPYLFIEAIQSAEDYYSRPYLSSILRLLRIFAFFISLTLPALYIAIEAFHQEMIPGVLLMTVAAAREGIPFPVPIETIIMVTIFELLRESGIRMPLPIGQAVSIVGALVIGQAAVEAGIVSAPMVIIIAMVGICSFIISPVLDAVIIYRFILIISSSLFGLFGVIIGLYVIITHMCTLKSFGTPFLSPFAPTIWKDLKDSLIRMPLWLIKTRPRLSSLDGTKRQGTSVMPNKPDDNRRIRR